jgi:hypothetical protein
MLALRGLLKRWKNRALLALQTVLDHEMYLFQASMKSLELAAVRLVMTKNSANPRYAI